MHTPGMHWRRPNMFSVHGWRGDAEVRAQNLEPLHAYRYIYIYILYILVPMLKMLGYHSILAH